MKLMDKFSNNEYNTIIIIFFILIKMFFIETLQKETLLRKTLLLELLSNGSKLLSKA